jgi:hypothetical protein
VASVLDVQSYMPSALGAVSSERSTLADAPRACSHLKMSRRRVLLICTLAGTILGATGLLIDATGYFNCDNWFESCTLSWAVFWLVLTLPWLVATLLLSRTHSITVYSCFLLGLTLSVGLGAWGILSASMNLDNDFARDDLQEAKDYALLFVIIGTPVVSIATGVAGVVFQSLLGRLRQRESGATS